MKETQTVSSAYSNLYFVTNRTRMHLEMRAEPFAQKAVTTKGVVRHLVAVKWHSAQLSNVPISIPQDLMM